MRKVKSTICLVLFWMAMTSVLQLSSAATGGGDGSSRTGTNSLALFNPGSPNTNLTQLLRQYAIPSANCIKFGDLDGDGRMDFVVFTPSYSAVAFNHEGKELWRWDAPVADTELRSQFEAPGVIWDFDRDGKAEVVHWRMMEGREWLVMADGRTGSILRKTPWPTPPMPHVYNNFRLAIARFHPGYARDIAVLTDSGGLVSLDAYDPDLKQLWTHKEKRLKDHLGHYPYPVDINGDGVDELVVSLLALDSKGKEIWSLFDQFPDNHDHIDDLQFADLNGDGELEMLAAQSDVGVAVYKARTGKRLWVQKAEHSQQINFGPVLTNVPAPQIAVNGRIYGNRRAGEPSLMAVLYWFDKAGNLLRKWPDKPVVGNPDFVKGDWFGNGSEVLFWHKFRLNADGTGETCFNETVYHMFDFTGGGADEVITQSRGVLKVYGCPNRTVRPSRRDPEYLRSNVANHSHY